MLSLVDQLLALGLLEWAVHAGLLQPRARSFGFEALFFTTFVVGGLARA